MAKIPIALQLYSVRGECQRDLPATLEAVANIGYQAVEPWGYGGDTPEWLGFSGKELRKMLDDNGLQCCGFHLSTQALLGDNLARTIDLNRELGNRFLIVAADKPHMSALDTIMEFAGILNDTAAKLQAEGMFTGYHAHAFDFVQIGDQTAWEILFSNTRPEVIMQMDNGNCASGGGDPLAMLRKFPGRARTVHLKEYGAGANGVIGEGKTDWPELFRLCETIQPTEWYVVEEGGAEGLGFVIPRRSLQALHRMGK